MGAVINPEFPCRDGRSLLSLFSSFVSSLFQASFVIIEVMIRKGKYTKRVTPVQQAKRQAKRRFRWWHELSLKKKILVIVAPILAFLIIIPLATYLYFARDISNQERLMNRNNTGIVLYASNGTDEIYSSGRAKHRELIPLDQISDYTENALIASEDKNFYNHDGFSIGSMLGAVYGNFVSGGAAYGGSTLTQQLAKNTLLTADKSYLRKFQELSIAIAIERTYSKDEILSMYLNSVYYGENAFGIADASQTYFGVPPDQLDLAQSAMLIGLLPAPSAYSPISGNIDYARERQNTVLTRMVNNGFITESEKEAAKAQQLTYQPAKSPNDDSKAPHFTEMVLNELYKKYGEEKVTRSGYQVTTTLDVNMQNQLQTALTNNIRTIQANGGSNASGIAIDPSSGEIRALVGSADWANEEFGKVNMVTTPRQTGSSFKPMYYAQALADGDITPATILEDKRTDFGGGFAPNNADLRFRGNVTVRNALNWSLNIPAVKVMQKVGVSESIETAKRMGITTIDHDTDYGLSLALGTAEVPLLEMTNAYAAFANGGEQYAAITIKNIQSKYNDKVFASKETAKQVISEQSAFLISDILSDNSSRSSVFGSSLNVIDAKTRAVKKAAVKTGTTDDSKDAWTIGYAPQLAVGVWVGNNDNTAMANGGAIMAGPIWRNAMGSMLAGVPTSFPTVPGVVQRDVCSNGSLANTSVDGQTRKEYFLSSKLPTATCSVTPQSKDEEKKDQDEEVDDTDNTSPVATTTSLLVSPSTTAARGTTVTFSASVSDTTASGTMTFRDESTTLGVVTVSNGQATFSTSSLSLGSHSITAQFTPTTAADFQPSTSPSVTYLITPSVGDGGTPGGGTGIINR